MSQEQTVTLSKWITSVEAAAIIGTVTRRTVEKWCRQSLLPSRQLNRRWYIHKEQLLKMLNFHENKQSMTLEGTQKH